MPLIAARFAAFSIGVLTLVERVLLTFWILPLTWRIDPPALRLAAGMVAFVASPLVPLLIYLWILAPLRRPPASLVLDAAGSRFTAPNAPSYMGPISVLLMWSAGGLVVTERVPNSDRVRMADFPAAVTMSVIGVTLFIALAISVLFINRPCLVLKPDGLTIRRLGRSINVGWDELAPGGPPPPAKRGIRSIKLYRKPTGPGSVAGVEKLPIGLLYVDSGFLTAVIRQYVEQPEHRNAIGTQAELDRLRTTFVPQSSAEATPNVVAR